jgi:hypothetical protein
VTQGGSGTLVTAAPAGGYHFVKWSDDITTASRTDGNVTADKTVTALFAETPGGTTTLRIQHDAAGVVFDRWVTGYSTAYSGDGYVYGRWPARSLRVLHWFGPARHRYRHPWSRNRPVRSEVNARA